KMAELNDPTPWRLLESAAALHHTTDDTTAEESLGVLLKLSLWGNKADGAYKQVKDSIRGTHATLDIDDAYLLADDSAAVIQHLAAHPTKPVHFINDNCGTEILLDLALADHLLTHSHAVWNQYRFYFELPDDVRATLATAGLVISKGDANYRRFLGDRLWPATTPLSTAAPFFPTSFVALRTMKSDPVVGIAREVEAKLNVEDPLWRINGKRGVIQAVLRE
ncbi:hypothetical protein DYB32_007195, partial [Aphanomyces invadans]